MNHLIVTSLTVALLSLSACNKPASNDLPSEPSVVPVPESSIGNGAGSSGDDAIQTKPVEPGDAEIQNSPVKPNGDSTIIIPPPFADMPPEVVPDKPQ